MSDRRDVWDRVIDRYWYARTLRRDPDFSALNQGVVFEPPIWSDEEETGPIDVVDFIETHRDAYGTQDEWISVEEEEIATEEISAEEIGLADLGSDLADFVGACMQTGDLRAVYKNDHG